MAAEIKEIAPDADFVELKEICPDIGEMPLRGIPRRHKIAVRR
jgi:hypothetical protein